MVNKLTTSFCRDHDSQCDESARAWVNMTGYQSRVLGRNIGDRFNPLEMDANHTVFHAFSIVLKKKIHVHSFVIYRIYP